MVLAEQWFRMRCRLVVVPQREAQYSAKSKTLHTSWFTTRNRNAILQPVAVQRVADMMPDQLGRQLAFTFPKRFERPQTAESQGGS